MLQTITAKTIYGHQKQIGSYDPNFRTAYFKQETLRHYFQKADAWGLDEEVVQKLQQAGCQRIMLTVDNAYWLKASMDDFLNYSWTHTSKGFAPRRFMAMNRWQKEMP